jgi:hypothetical protein
MLAKRRSGAVLKIRRSVIWPLGESSKPFLTFRFDDDAAFAAANEAIIEQALMCSRERPASDGHRLIAVVVREGAARSVSDATEGFRRLAASAGFAERIILTRCNDGQPGRRSSVRSRPLR